MTTADDAPGELDGSGADSSSAGVVVPEDCNAYEQDCPSGYKCTVLSVDDSATWNGTTCVPVVDDPVGFGEPCTMAETPFSGLDNCGVGALCWVDDQDALTGTCFELCGGSSSELTCQQPGATCSVGATGILPLCLLPCNPLGDDCAENEVCVWGSLTFLCAPDGSGDQGALGDPCEAANSCDPGLACTPTIDVVCTDPTMGGCCLPYCSVTEPDCPDILTCSPYWGGGGAPKGLEDVGQCFLPE